MPAEILKRTVADDGALPAPRRSAEEPRPRSQLKILTILGTRPEIIRLSRIIPKLDRFCRHVVVHTGQNYDPNLSDIFFQEMGIRLPDQHWGVCGTFAEQMAGILLQMERTVTEERPDRFLVLGDTNSSLAAICAKRMGVPVYHMEAGNRCYDDRVPEEVNRRLIDHCSDVLLPYTHRSKENLLREGIERQRIFVTGNPILEVMEYYAAQIESSRILEKLQLVPQGFFLVTLHRAENVDYAQRLALLLEGLDLLAQEYRQPVIVSIHPRTARNLSAHQLSPRSPLVQFSAPFGFFDFAKLERMAGCVLTDSGTVQEECALFGIANVIVRDTTERAETIECGSSVLSGSEPQMMLQAVQVALASERRWQAPTEYRESHVSDTVVKTVLGFRDGERRR